MSRLEVLLQTAADENGTCRNGTQRCATIYNEVLTYQSVPAEKFCHLIYGALEFGRQKGNAVMLVGGKDTGKTTITEPARFIFKAMQTPQSDSFCPLEDIRGYEVILWQDLRYNPGHPRKEEQGLRIDEGTWNRLLEGLPTLIGVPKSDGSRADFVYDDDAAFIFTGPFELLAFRNGMVDQMETEQLNCRMQYIIFGRPAPPQVNRGLKHCAWCWSRWILRGELLWRRQQGVARDEFLKKVACQLGEPETHDTMARACSEPLARDEAPSASSALLASMGPTPAPRDLFGQMSAVMEWRRAGLCRTASSCGRRPFSGCRDEFARVERCEASVPFNSIACRFTVCQSVLAASARAPQPPPSPFSGPLSPSVARRQGHRPHHHCHRQHLVRPQWATDNATIETVACEKNAHRSARRRAAPLPP